MNFVKDKKRTDPSGHQELAIDAHRACHRLKLCCTASYRSSRLSSSVSFKNYDFNLKLHIPVKHIPKLCMQLDLSKNLTACLL